MTENQHVEWKESWRDDYLKWICGFANAQGGVLEVGRNDSGKVVGIKNVLRLLEEIPNKVQSLLGIVVDVNLRSEGGAEYLQIVVGPYPHPISFRGEYHYRSGATKQVLRGVALSRFLMKKHGRTWDNLPLPGLRVGDLNGRAIDSFRRLAAANKRLPQGIVTEPDAGVIEKLGLRGGEHLNRAAILLFHSAPERFVTGAYVKVGYFEGTELLFQDVIEGDLLTQVDRTVDLLCTKYTRALVSYQGTRRIEALPVPAEAIREAVVNAVAHRDYATPVPIQIRVDADRIVLWNPGRLPQGWSLDELMGSHASHPHNPVVANAFFRAGLIEAWGLGVQRIVGACAAAGGPAPQWQIEPESGIRLELRFRAWYTAAEAAVVVEDRATQETPSPTQEMGQTTQEDGQTAQEPSVTTQEITPTTQEIERAPTTTRERILALLKSEPRITRRLMAERIGITPSGVKYHLAKLRKAGIIRHVGPTKAGRWEVLK